MSESSQDIDLAILTALLKGKDLQHTQILMVLCIIFSTHRSWWFYVSSSAHTDLDGSMYHLQHTQILMVLCIIFSTHRSWWFYVSSSAHTDLDGSMYHLQHTQILMVLCIIFSTHRSWWFYVSSSAHTDLDGSMYHWTISCGNVTSWDNVVHIWSRKREGSSSERLDSCPATGVIFIGFYLLVELIQHSLHTEILIKEYFLLLNQNFQV